MAWDSRVAKTIKFIPTFTKQRISKTKAGGIKITDHGIGNANISYAIWVKHYELEFNNIEGMKYK